MKRFGFYILLCTTIMGCQEGAHNDLYCDDSSYPSHCIDASHYMTCMNQRLIVVTCPTHAWCDTQTVSCQTAAQCQNDICKDTQTLISCQNGAPTEILCPHGCKDNACADAPISLPPTNTCTDSRCKDSTTLNACQNGQIIEVFCPSGCNNDQCVSIDPCLHVLCENGTCDKGICITDEMTQIQAGDPCDYALFQEFCNQDAAVYCNQGTVVIEPCAQGCSIVPLWDIPMAFCTQLAETCTTPNQVFSYCQHYENNDQSFDYESLERCLINTEGQYTRVDLASVGIMDTCDSLGCSDDMLHCRTPIDPLVCTYETMCQDHTLFFCQETFLGVWAGCENCTEQGQVCGKMDGIAACRTTCDVLNSQRSYCTIRDNAAYQVRTVCTAGDDNQAYEVETYTLCPHGCQQDTAECRKLSTDEGQTCQADLFDDRCEDSIAITCNNGIIQTEDCAQKGPHYTCRLSETGRRQCVEQCTSPGTMRRQCQNTGNWDVTYTYQCTETNNGNYYLLTDYEICSGHCNETADACLKLVPEEGESCESSSEITYCKDDIFVFCEDSALTAVDCASSNAVCDTVQGKSACYADYEHCESPGEIDAYCIESSWYGTAAYIYTCTTSDSGQNYWVLTHYESCNNGYGFCNPTGTACQ